MIKKVLCLVLATSLLVGTPAFAAVNLTNQEPENSIIDVYEKVKRVSVIGRLEIQPIYYIVDPGPNAPHYLLKLVTSSKKNTI